MLNMKNMFYSVLSKFTCNTQIRLQKHVKWELFYKHFEKLVIQGCIKTPRLPLSLPMVLNFYI